MDAMEMLARRGLISPGAMRGFAQRMQSAQGDPKDFTNRYNTPLSPDEEVQFQQWAQQNGRQNDMYDYDMRGYWKQNGGVMPTDGGHMTDLWKKPNHPTFSDQSIYHGQRPDTNEWDKRLEGGTWEPQGNGAFSFKPGASNLEVHQPDELQDYFKRIEPGNQLILPGQ